MGGSYIIKGGSWYIFLLFIIDVFSFFFLQFLDFPELFFCTKIDIIWRDHEEQISKEFSIWKQESERSSPHISSFLNFFFSHQTRISSTHWRQRVGEGDGTKRRLYKVRYYCILLLRIIILVYNPQLITHFIHFFFKYTIET